MGLAVCVGMLADLLENDPEGSEWLVTEIATANSLLTAAGLPPHVEPTVLPKLNSRTGIGSFPYSFLHYLRFAYARFLQDSTWRATPLPEGEDPSTDPVVEEEMLMFSSHLLCHSDCEGFYFPIPFDDVIFSDDEHELAGGMLGSSFQLRSELIEVAPALGISLSPTGELGDAEADRLNDITDTDEGLYRETLSWLTLFEATRLSIENGTAIVFS